MTKKTIAVLYGGGGSEHEISLVSGKYICQSVDSSCYEVLPVIREKNGNFYVNGDEVSFSKKGLLNKGDFKAIDLAIIWFHGHPGETGHIQGLFDLLQIPYVGCGLEAMQRCWNKINTKLWLEKLNVPVVPYVFLSEFNEIELAKVHTFRAKHPKIFIKASSQGSSVGCFEVKDQDDVEALIKEAFKFSDYVLVEKYVKAREIEFSAFNYQNELKVEGPGEINCDVGFYSYEEKYSDKSKAVVKTEVSDISPKTIEKLKTQIKQMFKQLGLKDFSRFDFFYLNDQEIYLNEINTIPGCTPISIFPKLIVQSGIPFPKFLNDLIKNSL
jgi:D-alanine-D-alanine ligase